MKSDRMTRPDSNLFDARLLVAFVLLLATSAYLAVSNAPTLFYFANVPAHIALAAALTMVVAWRVWLRIRRSAASKRGRWIPVPVLVASTPLAIGPALGLTLAFTGTTQPHRRARRA